MATDAGDAIVEDPESNQPAAEYLEPTDPGIVTDVVQGEYLVPETVQQGATYEDQANGGVQEIVQDVDAAENGDADQNNKRKFDYEDHVEHEEHLAKRPAMGDEATNEGIEVAATGATEQFVADESLAPEAAVDAAPEVIDPPGDGPQEADAAVAGTGASTVVIECTKDKVGKLIGKEGVTIREVQLKSNTRIQIDHKAAGDVKPVTISGEPADIEHARALIKEVLESEQPVLPGEVTKSVDCPQGIVGRIIGRGGETIRALQQASGAHIVVDQTFPEGVPRKVNISGKADAVQRAVNMVNELIAGDPSSTQQVIQKYGMGITRNLDCPKPMVGRVIGKQGDTIKSLQKQFGASIQIDQNSVPCRITLTGAPGAVEAASRAIQDLIQPQPQQSYQGHSGPRPSYQAPYPPYGGMPNPYGGGPFGFPPAPSGQGFGYFGGNPYGGSFPPPQPIAPSYPAYPSYSADPYASGYGGYGAPMPQQQQQQPAVSLWQELRDSEGRAYYYNSQTGVSQWEKPAELQ